MNRFILLFLTCVLGFMAARSLLETSQRNLDLVDLLPQDCLALIEGRHLPQSLKRWQTGLVGTTVLQPAFLPFLTRHHLVDSDHLPGTHWLGALNELSRRAGFSQLFAGHVLLALTSAQPGNDAQESPLLGRLLVLREVTPAIDVRREFALVFGEVAASSTSTHQGQTLHHLRFAQGQQLTYLLHDNLLLWAFNTHIVHQSVQQLVQLLVPTHTRRQSSATFLRLRQMAGDDSEFFIYAQQQALRTLLPQAVSFVDTLGWPIPTHLALFANPMPKGERLVVAALADEQQLHDLRQRYHLRLPAMKPALERLSASTGLVLWTNWLHLEQSWASLQNQGPADLATLLRQGVESLADMAGMSVESFLGLFGSEVGLFLDYIHAPHQAPRSKACLTIEILDHQRIEAVCKRLVAGLQTVEVLSSGLRIVTTILANGLLQPAYALFDQQLVLADGVELIERWYGQNRQATVALDSNPLLDGRRCNFFLFLRTADMVEWLLPMATSIGKEYAARMGEDYRHWLLADPVLTSFLANLRGIETSRIRSLIDNDALLLELVWTLQPHQ
jgi:hypothetical protein